MTQNMDTKHGTNNKLINWFDGDVICNKAAEVLREKLETLSLHFGTTASDYVNKYMMRYQELEKVPGAGMSYNHARYLFLRNIHDDSYNMTIKYLRSSGANLQECVTAIRKVEQADEKMCFKT
jgi:thermostable 8-oxoguanine DNA glycosylase